MSMNARLPMETVLSCASIQLAHLIVDVEMDTCCLMMVEAVRTSMNVLQTLTTVSKFVTTT